MSEGEKRMDEANKHKPLVVTVSPHIKSEESVSRIMWTVNISLLPAFIMGFYFFGPKALCVTALCIITAVLSEYAFTKSLKQKATINDGSAFLTGLLLGMNLPASLWSFNPFTIHIPIVASVVAIVITKQLFGGLGYNVFNPALVGRAFTLISSQGDDHMDCTDCRLPLHRCKNIRHPSWGIKRRGHGQTDRNLWRQGQPVYATSPRTQSGIHW